MARRTLRQRLLTPSVARAVMSPLGIVLFGAGAAGAILLGAPLTAAAAVGAMAWGGNVAFRVPRDAKTEIAPMALSDPWRSYVSGAQDAKKRFDAVVNDMEPGPLRDRLGTIASRLDDGVNESWRIAKRGNAITDALGHLTTAQTKQELEMMQAQAADHPGGPTAAMQQTIKSLQAQLDSADRLESVAVDAQDRLRLLDARFDELIARAVEVSVGAGDTDVLGNEVNGLVDELESLRVALDETEQAALAGSAEVSEPSGNS